MRMKVRTRASDEIMKTRRWFKRSRVGVEGIAIVAFALAGCDQGAVPDPPVRPSDGILDSPALQAVVDLQVAGDMYGLIDALESDQGVVRARAAFALASLAALESVDALSAKLGDADPTVRADVAFALGSIGDVQVVPMLGEALAGEKNLGVRSRILDALGHLGSPTSADVLLSADLSAQEEPDRAYALSRLGALEGVVHDGLRDRLIEGLTHDDPAVRLASSHFFRYQGGLRQWVSRAAYLRLALDSYERDDPAAMHLVHGLGLFEDFMNASRIRVWASEGTDWRIRADAMGGLDPMTPSAQILIDALDDPSVNVAVAAANRLSREALAQSIAPPIEEWIATNPGKLGVVAPLLVQLAQLERPEAVFAWVAAIPPGDDIRWGVGIEALSFVGGEAAVRALASALSDPAPKVVASALRSLETRWDRDRATVETHDIYFDVFVTASTHPTAHVFDVARRLLSGDELRGRALDAGLSVDPVERATSAVSTSGAPPTVAASVDWTYLAGLGTRPTLELQTSRGTIVVRLLPEEAPLTVQTVTRLAAAGVYDGVPFHRVVPNFVVQTGDYVAGDGSGDPGFTIPIERTQLDFGPGVLGMANRGTPDSQSSQLLITHSRTLELEGEFTAFGWIINGMDILDQIEFFDVLERVRVVPG